MSSCRDWADLDRVRLAESLPGAVVVLSVGAVEQHGAHLPSGTDALISQTVSRAAGVAAAASGVDVILAPPLSVGASDHHLPFGATVSLRAETYLAVLIDLLSSMATSGARRILLVNGHGGNSGACHAAAGAVSARHEVAIAHLDYWQLVEPALAAGLPVPGHAGAFETSLVLTVRPDLVRTPPTRPNPAAASTGPYTLHDPDVWRRLDGWTDQAADADPEVGAAVLAAVVEQLTAALVSWDRR
jgi:creatinine amidohydrolase